MNSQNVQLEMKIRKNDHLIKEIPYENAAKKCL